MTVYEAKKILQDYYELTNPGEDDDFLYTEALAFLIEETKTPRYMVELGGHYYGKKEFDLARKYYELAAEYDDLNAIVGLGYIWYYGRTGVRDYEKAFHYYDRARKLGDIVSAYKVADMYRNGYAVEKDLNKYREIIEELYPKVKHARNLNAPVPEIYTRLARIRADEGKIAEALDLYRDARNFLEQRIRYNPFFGNLNIMKWMIWDIYRLQPFDLSYFGLYDLYELLKRPVKVRFFFEETAHEVLSSLEEGETHISFDGTWYRTVDDFFQKAELDGELLTMRYAELYDFEVV